jgi:peroxiredoxin
MEGKMKKGIIGLIALVAVSLIGYAVWFNRSSAPEVSYTSLKGETTSNSQLKGKVVLINFWATSCTGCVEEMDQIKETYLRYQPQGYETVAVAMNYDPPNYVKTFVEQRGLPFFVTLDSSGAIAKAYGDIQLVPTSFLIGKDGKIIKRFVGNLDFKEVSQLIEQALKA